MKESILLMLDFQFLDGKVPADKYTILYRLEHIEPAAFYSVCAACVFGISLALFFLGFNLYHRKLK